MTKLHEIDAWDQTRAMSANPAQVVQLLNDLLRTDKECITSVFKARTPCNAGLADHPTVQVYKHPNEYSVGVMGLLNGLFGTLDLSGHECDGFGPISTIWKDGELVKFALTSSIISMEEYHGNDKKTES